MEKRWYVPTDKAGDWIMGLWRPHRLYLTERQAADEVRRGILIPEDQAPAPKQRKRAKKG